MDRQIFLDDVDRVNTVRTCLSNNENLREDWSKITYVEGDDDDRDPVTDVFTLDSVRFDCEVDHTFSDTLPIIDEVGLSMNDDNNFGNVDNMRVASLSWGALEYEIYGALTHDIPYLVAPTFILLVYTR